MITHLNLAADSAQFDPKTGVLTIVECDGPGEIAFTYYRIPRSRTLSVRLHRHSTYHLLFGKQLNIICQKTSYGPMVDQITAWWHGGKPSGKAG